MSNDIMQTKCIICMEVAHEPYIECCECNANLCASCFASGKELGNHKNDHKYSVRRNDFPLFENCNWSAKEECKLLTALSTCGFGNWEEISKSVHTRSKLECQEHYKKYFIENVQFDELNLLPQTEQSMFPKPVVPYLFNTDISFNPPRNNYGDQHLAGYNAQRSEFELSYDHNAESIFNFEDSYSGDEDNDDDECMDALKVTLVNVLNTRLKERHRRYEIIKNHGLIMPNKLVSWIQRYDTTLTRQKSERLFPFMQFMTGMQFDGFMESLSLEIELFQNLMRLHEYRRNGIKTLHSARIYKQLKKDNDVIMKEQKYATFIMMKKFESQSPVKNKSLFNKYNQKKMKRISMPLEITDLPGYHLLSETEKTLCSSLRLIPESYIEIKDHLIAENNKIGFLRLLDARRIVKIDVNKTRKIYDYLINQGHVSKPL